MIKAVGILGSGAAAAKLHARLRNSGITLARHNFQHPDEVLRRLEEDPEIAAVLIVERALKDEGLDRLRALEDIRAGDPTVRILFIQDAPERDPDFERWCFERQIYDIAYPGRHADVNVSEIGAVILRGRIDPVSPPPAPEESPQPAERRSWLDRFTGISLPAFKLPQLPTLPARKNRPKPPEDIRVIGVVNCSHGFGATTLTVNLARCLAESGHSVAVLAMDAKSDLLRSGLSTLGVTVSIPAADLPPDWDGLAQCHRYVIMDFGMLYTILPSGVLLPTQKKADLARIVQEAFDFCHLHLYLSSCEPWHAKKAKVFIDEDKGFILNREEADASDILKKLGVVP